jgi:hypothetical protein
MITQIKKETPTLAEAIRTGIRASLVDLYTAMPGQVESYNATTNLANVQPVFKRKYEKDEEVVNLPVINNVPVAFPRAGQAGITFPLKSGDNVLLVFSQRSLESWKTVGGLVEPNDPRTHDISDAIAIPGVYPLSNPMLVDPDNLVIRHLLSKVTVKKDAIEVTAGAGKITVDKTGKVSLGNGVIELLGLLDELIDQILALTVPTAVGPSGVPNNAAAITAIKAKLTTIKA